MIIKFNDIFMFIIFSNTYFAYENDRSINQSQSHQKESRSGQVSHLQQIK